MGRADRPGPQGVVDWQCPGPRGRIKTAFAREAAGPDSPTAADAPRAASPYRYGGILSPYFFAHESRSPTVRLKTGFSPGWWS